MRFLDHETGDAFTVFVGGLDTNDVYDDERQINDLCLAQQALETVNGIAVIWQGFKDHLVSDTLSNRREERRRAELKKTSQGV